MPLAPNIQDHRAWTGDCEKHRSCDSWRCVSLLQVSPPRNLLATMRKGDGGCSGPSLGLGASHFICVSSMKDDNANFYVYIIVYKKYCYSTSFLTTEHFWRKIMICDMIPSYFHIPMHLLNHYVTLCWSNLHSLGLWPR